MLRIAKCVHNTLGVCVLFALCRGHARRNPKIVHKFVTGKGLSSWRSSRNTVHRATSFTVFQQNFQTSDQLTKSNHPLKRNPALDLPGGSHTNPDYSEGGGPRAFSRSTYALFNIVRILYIALRAPARGLFLARYL